MSGIVLARTRIELARAVISGVILPVFSFSLSFTSRSVVGLPLGPSWSRAGERWDVEEERRLGARWCGKACCTEPSCEIGVPIREDRLDVGFP
jgi:hypothetical protein